MGYFFFRFFFAERAPLVDAEPAFLRRLLPLRPKISSQPSAYFFVLPTRTMLMAFSPLPRLGRLLAPAPPRALGMRKRVI